MRMPFRGSANDDCCGTKATEIEALARHGGRRRVLYVVLAINLVMFFVEITASWFTRSTALLADSADMLGDASVYALSIFVLARSLRWRAGAAAVKGGLMLALGVLVLFSAGRTLLGDSVPSAEGMSVIGAIALGANLVCLALLWQFRGDDINMSSTFECSRNDIVANVGVIVAALAVGFTGKAWPDVLAGLLIAVVFLRSAVGTLQAALPTVLRAALEQACEPGCACCSLTA